MNNRVAPRSHVCFLSRAYIHSTTMPRNTMGQAINQRATHWDKRRHAFCGNCGTPIYACAVDNPQSYSLRVGVITQRAALSPQRQIWGRSTLNWVDTLNAVPATEK